MNSIGCAPRQGPRQGPDRWDASSHSEKGNLHVAASESFTACCYLNITEVFPWFDVIGILSGFAHYADVTDVHVACTQFWSSCNSDGFSWAFCVCFPACSFHVLVLRTPAVPFFGPGLAIVESGHHGTRSCA